MAVIKEVASFDVDTTAAQKSINAYINSLQKLEQERAKNKKLGKSTTRVNKEISKTIKQINDALNQTTKTRKGELALLEATITAQNKLTQSSKKRLNIEKKVEAQTKKNIKSLSSTRRAFSNLKFLAVGAVAGLVAGLGQLGGALESLNALFNSTAALQNNLAEAVADTTKEYVKEKAALDNKFDAVNSATVGTKEHTAAVNDIVKQYGPYLSDLAKEELALGNSKRAQDEATASILKRLAAQTKLAVAEKLIGQIIDSQIEQMNRTAQANTGVSQGIEDIAKQQGNLAKTFIDPFGLFDEQIDAVTEKMPDLSEGITDIQNKATALKTTSAIEQLKKLGKVSDEFIAEFLQGFDGLADIFGDFKEGTEGAAEGPTKSVKDLTGTIAGLNKQLSIAKKFLQEGIQIADTEGLEQQQKLIGDIEKQIKDLQEFLKGIGAEPIPIGELEFFEPDLDKLFTLDPAKVEESLKKGLQALTISDLRLKLEQVELDGLIDIDAIERDRNIALAFFRGTAEERDALNATFNQKRLQREQQTAKAVIQLQLQILQVDREVARSAGENLTAIDKAIAQLKLSLTELDAQAITVDVDIDTKNLDAKAAKTKETLSTIVSGIEELGGQIIGFFAQQAAATLAQLESDVAKQQAILGELLSNQAGANAAQVQLERDRLDALVAQRKKATEQQAAIASTEIALNLAIGVARAAAEGGGIGSAFTIAALILAAGIGFIQARQQAQQAFAVVLTQSFWAPTI